MRDHRIGLDLFTDVLDVLERHRFARGDDQHAGRAIFLIGDLARIYEGTQRPPSIARRHRRRPSRPARNPNPSRPSPKTTWTSSLTHAEVSTVLTSLDLAADYKRDRAETCADCPDQSCFACQLRLRTPAAPCRRPDDEQAAGRPPPARPSRLADAAQPAPPRRGHGGGPVTTPRRKQHEPGARPPGRLRRSSRIRGRRSRTCAN